MDGFVHELSQLDEAVIMPIYPARELPMEGVTSDVLVHKIGAKAQLKSPHEVLDYVSEFKEGVILTIGAGDIDRIVNQVKERVIKNLH